MSRNAVEDVYRLSPLQEGMLFETLRRPGSGVYVIQVACRLDGRLDRAALERAWRETVERHPVLRTSFHWEGMEHPHQVVHRGVELPLRVEDWRETGSGTTSAGHRERFRTLLEEDRRRGFDLERAPLLRLTLLELGGGRWRLLWTHHHLILDGWSVPLVLREVFGRYGAAAGGGDPLRPVPPEPPPPFRRALERMLSRDREAAERFWRRELEGFGEATPVPLPEPAGPAPDGALADGAFPGVHRLELPRVATAALDDFARRTGVTPGTLVQAAWAVALSRWASADEVLFGVVVSGRPPELPGVEGMVGPFINTLPLRVPVPPAARLAPWLRELRERFVAVEEHGRASLVEIRGWSPLPRDRPLFETLVAFENYPLDGLGEGIETLGDLSLSEIESWERDAVPLGLSALPGERLGLLLRFDRRRFEGRAVRRLLEQVRVVLEGLAVPADGGARTRSSTRSPTQTLADLPSLPPAERHRLTVEWPRADQPTPDPEPSVSEAFRQRAAQAPDATALVVASDRPSDAGWITYGGLARRASRLAATLAARGAGPERPVVVLAEDPATTVTAFLATLEAGAVYVPLDPAHPRERLEGILSALAAGPAAARNGVLLLARPEAAGALRLPPDARVIDPAAGPGSGSGSGSGTGFAASSGADLPGAAAAYTIFTSGSTGTPNGVVVSRDDLARHLATVRRAYRLGPGDRVLQLQSFAFDASVEQVLAPLTAGACLVLGRTRGPGAVWGAAELADRLRRWRVTVANLPTAYWSEVVRALEPSAVELPALRLMLVGGEAMAGPAVRRWRELARRAAGGGSPARLVNAYGPTETVITATLHPVSPPEPGGEPGEPGPPAGTPGSVPIGRPLPGRSAVVLDPAGGAGRPVPQGAPGELCLGGTQARGYLDRPALTAERFVPDPRPDGLGGGRLVRTGDRVRWLPDGRLEFLGRLDDQVKVRGHRVEPAEVERALGGLPEVAEAAVVARRLAGAPGAVELAAFAVPEPGAAGETVTGPALRARLTRILPEALVPATVLVLDALPRTATGKVDRRALESTGAGVRSGSPRGGVAGAVVSRPRTPIEEKLAGLWSEVLGAERVGRDDRFFDLGGHSLLAMRLVSRIRDLFGVDLPLGALFERPTVAELAREVERGLTERGLAAGGRASGAPDLPPLRRRRRSGAGTDSELGSEVLSPASAGQERLWFLDRLDPSSAAYNLPLAVRVVGTLDPPALDSALSALAARHETLRTTFAEVAGRPMQRIAPAPDRSARPVGSAGIPRVDLTALPEARGRAEAERWTVRESARPFDLARGPLMRAVLLRLAGPPDAGEHRLLLTLHHAISDEWSLAVLIGDLVALYGSAAGSPAAPRTPSPLPPLPIQYADWAAWQREWIGSPAFADAVERRRDRLAGAPAAVSLPTDRPRPAARTDRGGRVPLTLAAPLAEGLRRLGREQGASLFMVLLAALHAWLRRHGAGDDLVLGSPVANRTHRETEGLIGFFVDTVAVRTTLPGAPRFDELLGRVRADALEAFAHQWVPFERVVEAVAPDRGLSHAPLVQVMLALHTVALPRIDLEGLVVEPLPVTAETAKFDLLLELTDGATGGPSARGRPSTPGELDAPVEGALEYSADLFDRTTAARLADHLVRLLEGVARRPEARIDELPFLSGAEHRQVCAEWAGPLRRFPAAPTLPERFAARAAERPDAVAVVCGAEAVTYGELRRRADGLARRLIRSLTDTPARGAHRGALGERRVGLLADRSVELVEGVLGVLAAGAAYVPLDPRYPAERLGFVLDDAGVDAVVAGAGLAGGGALPPTPGRTRVAIREPAGDRFPEPLPPPDPGALAYVIYTSGSTGRPKGVQVEHGAVARLFRATGEAFAPGPDDAWSLFHSPAFDFSVWELWGALAHGGRLEVVPYWQSRSAGAFLELLAARRVTILSQTPSAFRALGDAVGRGGARRGPEALPAVRWLVFGGERLEPGALAGWLERSPEPGRLRAANLYGITETTVHTTFRELTPDDLERPWRSPIGRPLPDLVTYVAGPGPVLAPIGVAGELLVGGAGLARGYLGRPALTAERFVPDPFADPSTVPGSGRLYRSGDLARWLPSGELESLGRIDHQVKVRGFRIEPGEVEAALESLAPVARAVVTARDDLPGGGGLVAHVVPDGDPPADSALREALLATLPEFMVPVRFVLLDRLPLTASGKVDRGALPAPSAADAAGGDRRGRPADPARTPLERDLARIWAEVLEVERVGVAESFFDLGGHSLLATQVVSRIREELGVEVPVRTLFARPTVAGLAAELDGERPGERIPPRPDPRERPLSPAQERLWFLDRFDPGTPSLNIAVGLRLRGRLDPAALAWALDRLRRRHEMLRTAFPEIEGRPAQVVRPHRTGERGGAGEPALPVVDLAALTPERRREAADRLAAAEAMRPFRVAEGPLFRVMVLRVVPPSGGSGGAGEWRLHLTVHHLVADGWSLGILVRELTALYRARLEGAEAALPELPIDYADYARWIRGRLDRGELSGVLDARCRHLAGAPPALELPTDRPRPPVQALRGGRVTRILDPVPAARIRRLARSADASLFMVLLAGFGLVLGRWAGQREVVIGAPVAGRTHRELEGLVGLFLNHLALRLDLGTEGAGAGGAAGRRGGPSFRDLLERARAVALDAFEGQEVPFELVLDELARSRDGDGAPIRDLSRTPVFQVFLNVLNFPLETIELPGLAVEPLGAPEAPSKFDLELYALEPEGGDGPIRLDLAYDAALFDRWRAEEVLDQLAALLDRAADRPEAPAASLSLLTGRGRRALPVPAGEAGDSALGPWVGPVHALLERRAAEAPDRVAVVDEGSGGGSAITYGRLQAAVERLAAHLAAQGAGPGDVVAIHGRRGPALAVAVLGTLRAGAAFLLLDPAHPPARNALCLEAARPRAWLALGPGGTGPDDLPEEIAAALAGLPGSRLDRLGGPDDGRGDPRPDGAPAQPPAIGPDDPAYVAFTSGSTGTPKGVVGLHGSLTRFLPWQERVLELTPDDRFSLLSGLAHDPLHRDLFTPLQAGASVVVPDGERLGEPGWIAAWMARLRVTVAHLTPALGQVLTEAPRRASGAEGTAARPGSLRAALFVGDRLTRRDVERLRRLAPGVRVINLYGATETERAVGWHSVRPTGCTAWRTTPGDGAGREGDTVPLGGEMPGVELVVTDAGGGPAGIGEVGEIEVRSPHLAGGYLRDPRLTAERFRPDPGAPDCGFKGGRAYRTGDLGRHRGDGTVEPLGRADRQVKIRGFRVEPGEVEAALETHPAVRRAAVVPDPRGAPRLVAYAVPASPAAPETGELRRFLADRLPDPMVPAAFVVLDRLPMTPNRKLDRSALPAPPAPGAAAAATAGPSFLPGAGVDPAAELVAGIWREVLGIPDAAKETARLGPETDFFELGGHSLQVTRVLARIRETFGVELPVRSLFEHPSLGGFARRIESARRSGGGAGPTLEPAAGPAPAAGGVDEDLPLSFGQERLWFLHRLAPESPLYHLSRSVGLRGPLDRRALARSLDRLARRHESLRTGFHLRPGGPVQRVAPGSPVLLAVAALDALPADRREAESDRLLRDAARRPFDLSRPPLVRTLLVGLGPEEHRFAWTLHHAVTDGWSMGLLVRDLAALYREEAGGAAAGLPELPVRYADYAAWQRRRARREVVDEALTWWRERLDPPPEPPDLPVDRSRASTRRGAPARRWPVAVPAETAGALRRLARAEGATPFMVVLAAFQALLGRWSGASRVAVGIPVADRRDPRLEGVVGFFVDTLVLVGDLEGDPGLREVLARAREETLGAFAHRDLPFERLVEELQPVRDRSRPPLFQVMLAYQNVPRPPATLGPDLTVEPLPPPEAPALFDLTLSLAEAGDGGLSGSLEADGALFDPATVRRLSGHLERLLAGAVAEPDRRLVELPLLSAAERHQVLIEWSRPDGAGGTGGVDLLHRPFEDRAAETPDAVAVVQGERALTYGALRARAEALAAQLRADLRADLGTRPAGSSDPEPRIGIALERSPEQMVALFGVLMAGAAYVPLDPELPAARIARIAREAGIAAVLVGTGGPPPGLRGAPDGVPTLPTRMMARDGGPPGPPAERPAPPADRPAYVIFTSGSTGVPKGVVVSHRAAARFCRGAAEVLGLGPADRRLQLAPLSFDASVADVFPVLGRGGTLILRAPGPIGSLGSLLSDCRDRRVTVLGLPTALWHELAATDTPLPPSVRRVVFGGEAALAERVLAWRRRAGSGVALLNSYGPTETAVAVATCELAAPGLALGPGGEVPIGRPNLGDRILVLDPEARPVPAGVTGELWVGGPGLARGYLDRPGRTAESFRPDPSVRDGGAPGGRLYRTGDLGRWLPDGTLVFSGRADRQVKVRGYRVELGEVESALAEHPAVRESVVSLVRGPGGVGALVAHAAGSDLDPDRLRTFLGDRLPAWSVPAAIVLLDALPRTPSGKIDRRALPAPDPDAVRGGAGATAPRTDLERRIAAVWEDVLEIRPVGVTDDFFELGGHSLLAVRLAARLERTLGRPFPLATLFEHPTVESLAASLGRGGAPGQAPGRGPVPLLVPLRARPGVLSGSPRRRRVLSPSPLVLVHPAGGSALCYTELARRLEASGSRRPVWGLQAPGFEGEEEPLETVGELAERFLDELEWGLGGAPVRIHLAGWSFGGLVAFELARRLGRRVRRSGNGRRPGVVAVLDAAPGRAAGGHGAGAVHEDEADLLARALSEAVPGVTGDELRGLDHGARMATLMRRARERGVLPPGSEEDLFGPGPEQGAGRLLRVFTASLRAAEAYRPAPFEGDLVLFRATGGSRLPARDPAAAWRPFVRGTTAVVDVPGDHRSVVTGDGARAVAAALAGLLAARDGA